MDRACIQSFQLWNMCHQRILYRQFCSLQSQEGSIFPLDILSKCHLHSSKSLVGRERCAFRSCLCIRNLEGTAGNLSNPDLHSSHCRTLQGRQELFDSSSQWGRLCRNTPRQVSRNQVCMGSLNQRLDLDRHSQLDSPCRQSHPD